MAVGVAVASAFTAIVTAFTKGVISPLIALLTDNATLSEFKWVIRDAVLDESGAVVKSEISILWGALLQAVIDFFIIALVMFIFLKIFTLASKKAAQLRDTVVSKLTDEDEIKAAAEAKAKAEAETKAKAEAEAKAKLEAEQKEKLQLLRDIKDLLKEGKRNG